MQYAADENFHGDILEALQKSFPDLDVIRVQDTHLYQAPDPEVLEWAAQENRIILTHDVQTLVGDAYARLKQGLPMPGVILVPSTLAISKAIHELEVIIGAGQPNDFVNRVFFVS